MRMRCRHWLKILNVNNFNYVCPSCIGIDEGDVNVKHIMRVEIHTMHENKQMDMPSPFLSTLQ